jgi:hypothetical protein
MTTGLSIGPSGTPAPAFVNLPGGSFVKTAGTGTGTIFVPFDNDGTVDVRTGTLTLSNSGSAHAGNFSVSAGATLELAASGNHGLAGDVTGAGTLRLAGGPVTVDVNGTYSVATTTATSGVLNFHVAASFPALNVSGSATLGGSASLTIPAGGTFNWSGGVHAGAATTTVAPGGTLNMSGSGGKTLEASRRIRNEGNAVHGDGTFQLLAGTAFDNAGTYEMTGDFPLTMSGSPMGVFTNLPGATLTKAAGVGTATAAGLFDNDGTVVVRAGTLRLHGAAGPGTAHAGAFAAEAGGTLQFSSGTHVLGGAVTGAGTVHVITSQVTVAGSYSVQTTTAGSGTLTLNVAATLPTLNVSGSATLAGPAPLTVPAGGTFNWAGGTHTGAATTTIAAGGTLNLSTSNGKALDGSRRIRNEGVTVYSGTTFQMFSGTGFDNAGTFEMTSDASIGGSGAPAPSFANRPGARFVKSTGTATGTVLVPFDNDGTVEAMTGTLQFAGPFPAYDGASRSLVKGSYLVFAALRLPGADVANLGASVTLDGAGAQVLDSGGQNGLRALTSMRPSGSLTLRNGKTLLSSGPVANAGAVTVGTGSVLESTGAYTQTAGTTTLDHATARLRAGGATVDVQGGTLQGVGTAEPSVRGAGLVRPGLSPGTLSVGGPYDQPPAGTLEVELSGAGNDQLVVSGAATLDGGLAIVTDPAFIPVPGDEYRILGALSRAGEFAQVTGGELDGDSYYQVDYRPDSVVLVVRQRTVGVADVSTAEGTGGPTTADFTVSISRHSGREVRVDYRTGDGTATAGADYTATSGTVVFAPGETAKTVPVGVSGDALHERDEDFVLALSSPFRASIDDGQAVGTILNDDPPPAVSIGDTSVVEGTGGTTTAGFTVSLSAPSGLPASVDYTTKSGHRHRSRRLHRDGGDSDLPARRDRPHRLGRGGRRRR